MVCLNMHIALIRFALVAPVGDIGSESTPPIGLAYLSAVAKKHGATVVGVDAAIRLAAVTIIVTTLIVVIIVPINTS